MDTIILNEVGGTTDPGDLEKQEVLKVVLNRADLKYYSSLSPKDTIYKFIDKKEIEIKKYPWLNLMLKEESFLLLTIFSPPSNHVFLSRYVSARTIDKRYCFKYWVGFA